MSVTIITPPAKITKAANPALWVVSGSNNAQANFRYVADVSGTTLLGRLKCDKLPNNQGFFDVRKLVRTLVVPTKPKVGFQYDDANVLNSYAIGFREEFGTPPTVATGVTNASGLVQYGYDRQSETYDIDKYYSEAFSQSLSVLSDKHVRNIRVGQNDYLSVLLPPGADPIAVEVSYPTRSFTYFVTAAGLLSTIVNTGLNGLAAVASGNTSDGLPGFNRMPGRTSLDEWNTWNALCTADGALPAEASGCLFARFDALWVSFGDSYTIEIKEGIYDLEYSEITYNVQTCERFKPVRVLWRNKLGGIDAYEFTMKNNLQGNVERETYRKNTNTFGIADEEQVWQAEFEETWRLESDWLTQADSSYLAEMIYSPEVYVEQPNALLPAVVQTTQYEFFQKPQDKLVRLSVQVKLAEKTAVL